MIRSAECDATPEAEQAEAIALALMGVGQLAPETFAEAASWERGAPLPAAVGREAILDVIACLAPPERIELSQIATHGKAGSVAGRILRPGAPPRLFCHLIRYTSAETREVAQLISFEHAGGRHER